MSNNEPDYKDNLFFEPKPSGTLTEQWKKGKLPAGEYYIKYPFGETTTGVFDGKYWECLFDNDELKEVLAPVPSYEEWVSARKFTVAGINAVNEIAQLKELLKRARKYLSEQETPYSLIKRIDEALK